MQRLKSIVEGRDSRTGVAFDLVTQAFIVLSLIAFSIETLPNLPERQRAILTAIELTSIVVFSAEYCLRFFVATRKLDFVFSFYGLVDLFAILPFFLALGLDLRSLRVLRLLRLARVLKLFRYGKAIARFQRAFQIAKEELVLFAFVTMLLLYLSAVGIYHFENAQQPEAFSSVFDGLWWAVATLTTVGYGDVYPVTVGGRFFTFVILMLGLGVVAVPSGLVASALSKAREEED